MAMPAMIQGARGTLALLIFTNRKTMRKMPTMPSPTPKLIT
jgi:hypothetical protein